MSQQEKLAVLHVHLPQDGIMMGLSQLPKIASICYVQDKKAFSQVGCQEATTTNSLCTARKANGKKHCQSSMPRLLRAQSCLPG